MKIDEHEINVVFTPEKHEKVHFNKLSDEQIQANLVMQSVVLSHSDISYRLSGKKKKGVNVSGKQRYNFLPDYPTASDVTCFHDHGYKLLVLCKTDLDLCTNMLKSRLNLVTTNGWAPNCETYDTPFLNNSGKGQILEDVNICETPSYIWALEYIVTLNDTRVLDFLYDAWNPLQLRFEYCNEAPFQQALGVKVYDNSSDDGLKTYHYMDLYEHHLAFYSWFTQHSRVMLRIQKYLESAELKPKAMNNYLKMINSFKYNIKKYNLNPNIGIFMDYLGYQPVAYSKSHEPDVPCYFMYKSDDKDTLCYFEEPRSDSNNSGYTQDNRRKTCVEDIVYTSMFAPEIGISSLYPIMFNIIYDSMIDDLLPKTVEFAKLLFDHNGIQMYYDQK